MQHQQVIEVIADVLKAAPDVRVLFLGDSYGNGLAGTGARMPPNPARMQYQIEEFIRVIGLLHVGAAARTTSRCARRVALQPSSERRTKGF